VESEQVQRLRRGFELWNRGDWEEALEYFSSDVTWRAGAFFPGLDPVYEGHDGLRRFFRGFADPWEEVSISLYEVIDERPEWTLIRARFQARGREGIAVDAIFFQIWRWDEDGLVSEFDGYETEEEARRAAGLSD
jgi:ketosteroid isomerase-like protein